MEKRKNILIFVLDQLAWRALKQHGGDADTPNVNTIIDNGVMADAAYCPFPLCQPSRASFWSGQYSHRNQVWSNGREWKITELDSSFPALGETFSKAGYECRHFGKKHDGGALRGFICEEEKETYIPDERPEFPFNFDTYNDVYAAEKASAFLSSYDKKKPLLIVADFINPHNICGYIGKNKGKHENAPADYPLPELPDNFYFDDIINRPIPVQYLCCSHVRQSQTSEWTEENFRHYLAAYYYYLSVADRHIGMVLSALKENNMQDDTLIVFFSDHGDNMASRRSVTKQVTLYEEVTRVPLFFSGCGVVPRKEPVKGICSLLDIFPTLCSYAGIEAPDKLDGVDISSMFTSGKLPEREYVTSEWFTEWGYTISPGRMIRSGNFKYIHYLEGNGEELYDLGKDPLEKRNEVKNPLYKEILGNMRTLFEKYLKESNDPYQSLEWKADKRWRSHECGYEKHIGIAAPEEKK